VFPEFAGAVYPGFTHFDKLLGLSPLPFDGVLEVVGWMALIAGVYYLVASNLALGKFGSGFAAF